MKTNFIIAGAQRSGTATLHRCLSQHPQICTSNTPATHFFDSDALFERGTPSFDNYHSQFDVNEDHVAMGEASSNYTYWIDCIPRIYRYNPEMKIIFLLRNPVDRAYSQWQEGFNQGYESVDFINAVNLEYKRIESLGTRGQHKYFSYIDRGLYSHQIEHLLQYFDPHQLLFLRSEDFKNNTSVILYRVYQFLNVPFIHVDETAQNIGNYKRSLPPEIRNELINLFRRDISRVEELLGWDCRDWLKPAPVKVKALIHK